MAPTGARRPSETRGDDDTELVITAEVVDRFTDEGAGAEAELIEVEGPAEAG